jgi:hypothetical protein
MLKSKVVLDDSSKEYENSIEVPHRTGVIDAADVHRKNLGSYSPRSAGVICEICNGRQVISFNTFTTLINQYATKKERCCKWIEGSA